MQSMIASRLLRLALAALAASCAVPALAATPALVVDADSGKVLYAERATDPWYPASVTKLMTVYVALDLVRQGRASMDQLLAVTPEAAAAPPSKMGFKPGTTITLDNALKIIMVKSANDVSLTIAEGLGGSVEGFADMMNEAGRRLGMRESRWANPNGLPDERQWTSARDMAILGRALLREFPERRDLFSISAIQFGRRVMANHNGLLGRYPGVDGMKTGFICASGFNVVASATRNGRRLITVVMGSPNARERTLKAAELFDRGFASMSWGGQRVEELPAAATSEPRNMRAIICERSKPEPEEGADVAGGPAGPVGDAQAPSFGLPSSALAFAGMNPIAWRTGALPPRAPLQPVLVWTGRDPAESLIAADASGTPRGKGRRSKVANAAEPAPPKKAALRARVDAAIAKAQASATEIPAIIEDGGKPAKAVRPAAVASRPAPTKPAAKPARTPAKVAAPSAKAAVKSAEAKPLAISPKPKAATAPKTTFTAAAAGSKAARPAAAKATPPAPKVASGPRKPAAAAPKAAKVAKAKPKAE